MRYLDPNGPMVRDRDAEGRLVASGYCWAEREKEAWSFVAAGVVFLIVGIVMLFVADVSAWKALGAILFGLVLAPAAIWFSATERSVVFLRDGTISFPRRIPFDFSWWRSGFNRKHPEITSIEAMPCKKAYGVVLMTVHGESLTVSFNLEAARARLVSVQLTRALTEMRQSIATINQHAPRPSSQRAAAWIG